MLAFIARRLMSMVLVMLLVACLFFIIVRIVPGDPAAVMLGDTGTPADVAKLRASLGLDRALPVQFMIFMRDIASGDLGHSIFLDQPVRQAIQERASLTALLTTMAITIAMAIRIPIGVIAAVRTGSVLDQVLTTFATLAGGVPSFWIGLSLIH